MRRSPNRLQPASTTLLTLLCSVAGILPAAPVTLVYDASRESEKPKRLFFSGNWNPDTGAVAADWNGYRRYPMYDDGTNGDEKAGDGVWCIQQNIQPAPTGTFQWAVDTDDDGSNGWLGAGTEFRVLSQEAQTVPFLELPPETTMTVEELIEEYGVDFRTIQRPTALNGGEAIAFVAEYPEADQVFLAGSFNQWANNDEGVVSGPQYRMYRLGEKNWVRILPLPHGTVRYKFAVRDKEGSFTWHADSSVPGRDPDGNTVLDLRTLMPDRYVSSIPGRPLVPIIAHPVQEYPGPKFADIRIARTWIRPDESHEVGFTISRESESERVPFHVRYTRDFIDWEVRDLAMSDRTTTVTIPGFGWEKPILVEAILGGPDKPSDREILVLPVVTNPSDDLRYGFYSNWDRVANNYARKSEMLADLLLNAMEYYDYFPAHGKYAPTEEVYEFDPFFGRKIHARDIKNKIESDRERGILAIAYVAAYAASASVYREHPYPMTTKEGIPRVFNGRVLPETEADEKGERKWFWLMAIARDTPWYTYIMEEFRRTLTDEPGDLVAFDGFEIDSYGHAERDRYYSIGSEHSGRLLADVIAEFIEDVWRMSHEVKEDAAVSFNCVCEFGIDRMYEITDFLFVENWVGCKAGIEETVDICYRHREATRQRAVLKMYPPDAGFRDPAYFPPDNLRMMLGMCITGGGSLMIVGEPNERTGQMHALNTLYYPSNVALPSENVEIIRRYNQFDAMLYGYNHGRMVKNYETTFYMPGCVSRAFENESGAITVMLLNNGKQMTWDSLRKEVVPLRDVVAAINVPSCRKIARVLFASPDDEKWLIPVELDFEQKEGYVRVLVPELHTLGAIILLEEE